MSCCGCASRVLKLQSEIRSWKTKLGDEKREKKMILRWIMAVFGYDVRVDIEKESRGIRLQATENKEGVQKALIKLGLGGVNEGDLGMMVMELKLEDQEFFEPFEEPHDIPEFPILEINSMSTQQAPLVNTGISTLGHISQALAAPTLSITTPMEVSSTQLPISSGVDQEVVYIAGNFEDGATLEGINGQSYIIVGTNESEGLPMQMDYALTNSTIGVDTNNLYLPPTVPSVASVLETPNAINTFLPVTTPKNTPLQLSLPTVVTPAPATLARQSIVPETVIEELSSSVFKSSSSSSTATSAKAPAKKKTSLSSTKSPSQSSSNKSTLKKQKSGVSTSGEPSIKTKNVVSQAQSGLSPIKQQTKNAKNNNNKSTKSLQSQLQHQQVVKYPRPLDPPGPAINTPSSTKKNSLTLREKAEMYVMQKSNDAVERVRSGFRCTVCLENRYIYSNFDSALAHTKTHFKTKPYKCEYCDELFAIQKELLKHKRTVHSKPKGAVVVAVSAAPSPLFLSRLTTSSSTQINVTAQQQSSKLFLSHTEIPTKAKLHTLYSQNDTIRTSSGNICSSKLFNNNNNKNKPNPVGSHVLHSQLPKTTVVQAPFDNNFLSGSISVSNEVLEALLARLNSSVVTASQAQAVVSTENKSFSPLSVPDSRIPDFFLATPGEIPSNNSQNIDFSLENADIFGL